MYNRPFYEGLARAFQQHYPPFPITGFLDLIFDGKFEVRGLKERMHHTALIINEVLTGSYAKKISILKAIAPTCEDGFTGIFFPDFVATFGMDEADYEISINALEYLTQYSSSEFAVRPFIQKHPERMMQQMLNWSYHQNHHVRRLASEGCRPRLPWGMALNIFKKDPAPILPILENLKTDSSDYVRRSVANNLNDISKDHPQLVLDIGEQWIGQHEHTDWIIKHACRTLLKKGNQQAMRIFGFGDVDNVSVSNLNTSKDQLAIGESLSFGFDLQHSAAAPLLLRLEFGVDYMKANGSHSRKVFQIAEKSFAPNQVHHISKKQHFRNLTTRKHYPGTHYINIIINGIEKARTQFVLVD